MSEFIQFSHDNKAFCMTDEEIEAAFSYQQHRYRLEDAKRHLKELVFGCDDGSDFDDPDDEQSKEDFAEKYGISYDEAISVPMLEEYIRRYEARLNYDNGEDSQWEAAIEAALHDVRDGIVSVQGEDVTTPQRGEAAAKGESPQARGMLLKILDMMGVLTDEDKKTIIDGLEATCAPAKETSFCPLCQGEVDFFETEYDSEGGTEEWNCPHCGASGRNILSAPKFIEYDELYDGEGKKLNPDTLQPGEA